MALTVPEIRLPVPWYNRASVHWTFILGMIALFLLAWALEPAGRNPWIFLPTLSPVLILLINRRHGLVGLRREGSDLLLFGLGPLWAPHRGDVRRLPVAQANLEWVGRSLFLTSLGDGSAAPGGSLGRRGAVEPALAWLEAQGVPPPVGG